MHVLFVEDDEVVAQSVEMALRANGHDCKTTDLGANALTLAKHNDYDIVVLDVDLPDMDGYHVVRRMKMEGIETPLLMQSGLDDPDLPSDAESLGIGNFLAKPFSIAELLERMEVVLGISEPAEPEPAPDAGTTATAPAPQPEPRASVKSAATIWAQSAAPVAPAAPAAPIERPSAVAAARQALRDQPEPPSRLQAASEAVAESGAKALSKAGSGAKALSSRAESGAKALSSKAEYSAKAFSSTAESGAKAFSKVVTKARSAVGPKHGGETGPRSEPELTVPPAAGPDTPRELAAEPKPAGEKRAKPLSMLVAKARSVVEAIMPTEALRPNRAIKRAR